jgi:hypothetical protein
MIFRALSTALAVLGLAVRHHRGVLCALIGAQLFRQRNHALPRLGSFGAHLSRGGERNFTIVKAR